MAIHQRATGLFSRVQSLLDRVVSPDSRQNFYTTISNFYAEQPLLASFVFLQLLLSSLPLALFLSFTLGTLLLSLIAAILFSLFWIGIALCVLIPILFVSVSTGIVIWIWAVCSFVVLRWVWGFVPVGKAELGVVGGVNGSGGGKKFVVGKGTEEFADVKAEVTDV